MLASDLSEEMKQLAITDPLTQCLNRRGFYEKAQSEIGSLLEKSQHVCLIYWDIDFFKSINDKYGHAGGDKVLAATVSEIRQYIKQHDLIGRMGGEEFVILLGRTNLTEAQSVAERIRALIEAHNIKFEQQEINVTASFGVANIDKQDKAIEHVIYTADKALYEAKEKGRNRVIVAS